MLSEPKGAPEPILEGRVWDRFDALGRSSPNDPQFARRRRPDSTNCVEEPLGRRERIAVATRIRAVDFEPFALCGEDRCRKGDELRQFPQGLGCSSRGATTARGAVGISSDTAISLPC